MAWKTVDVQEQRVRFVVCALRREKISGSARSSTSLGRPVISGFVATKREALRDRREESATPASPRQTTPEIEQRVVALRQQRPDWGARKLQVLLQQAGVDLPVITVHRILLRHHLVKVPHRFLGRAAVSAGHAQPAVADGFQRPAGLAGSGGSAIGAGRSQPLCDCAGGDLVHASRACAGAAGRSFSTLRRARRNADGSWHAVVEHERGDGLDLVNRLADETRYPPAFQRLSASADARKSGALPPLDGRDAETARLSAARSTGRTGWTGSATNITTCGLTKRWG